jgi:uncharacterized protein
VIGISGPQQALLLVVLQNAIFFGLTVGLFWVGVFATRLFGRTTSYSLAPLGFARPRRGFLVGAGVGLLAGVGALILSVLINPLSALVLESFGYPVESGIQQPLIPELGAWVQENPAVAIPAIVTVVVFLGPAVEELVFRGGVFNGLYRLGLLASSGTPSKRFKSAVEKASFVVAALASSLVFALLHLEPVLFPAFVVLGFVLCALFKRSGSLIPPVAAHATFNSFATLLIILSGLGLFELPM